MSQPSEMTDEQIVAMFATDFNAAVGAAFTKYMIILKTNVARWIGWESAEDAILEAAVGILKSGPPEHLNGDGLRLWLFKCVRNAVFTGFRKQRTYERAKDKIEKWIHADQSAQSPQNVLMKAERRLLLFELIDEELTGFERELMLDYLSNSEYTSAKEQAKKFGKTKGTIEVTRTNCRKKLRAAASKRKWTREMFFWE